jgi:hypothetical protein
MGAEAPAPPALSDEQKQALTQCVADLASDNFETRTNALRK